ncbi:MAG: ArsC family reductase [Gammaproteobacteria bacterium]
MMTTLYGIPNCDTMKKARKWLADNGVEYAFHDYKKLGIEQKKLDAWIKAVGWETLLNRRGMMWRKVPDDVKASIDEQSAIRLMLETPSIIKRPVLEAKGKVTVGFKPETYEQLFG